MDTQSTSTNDDLIYKLPYSLYKTTSDVIPLDTFNISVTVSRFKKSSEEQFGAIEKFNQLVGKTFLLKQKKTFSFYVVEEGNPESILLNEDMFFLKFSTPTCPALDINKFIQSVKTADVSTEFYQVARSMIHGYPDYKISHHDALIYDGLKQFLKAEPHSFAYLEDCVKNNKALYFPSFYSEPNLINKFKVIMENEFKGSDPHLNMLKEYISDWSDKLNKQPTQKKRLM